MTNNPTYTTELLVTQLHSDDSATRFDAASLIGIDRVTDAADALAARLGAETDCQVRERVTWATVQVIDAALPAVLALLDSPDAEARMQAAHVLSKAARPEFAAHLAPLVADADAQVAIKAYRAAANTGDPAVVPLLAARLGDGDAHQTDALTNAFVTLGGAGVPALVEALTSERVAVRRHAAETLGHLGPDADAAVDALTGATADADAEVRVMAATALGQLGPVADEALAALAAGDDSVLASVAGALAARRKRLAARA